MKILQLGVAALMLVPLACMAQGKDAVADGKLAYMKAGCYQCHGTVGQGGVGPKLAPKPFPVDGLIAFVRNTNRAMPAYGPEMVSDADLRRIHAYLSAIPAPPPVEQIPQLK